MTREQRETLLDAAKELDRIFGEIHVACDLFMEQGIKSELFPIPSPGEVVAFAAAMTKLLRVIVDDERDELSGRHP